MAFPLKLASILTGLTTSQLRRLRKQGTVVPEVNASRPPLYSFRDLVVLRTIAKLRAEASAQMISTAFGNLDLVDLTEHPSTYKFGTDGATIYVEDDEGDVLDLVKSPGQRDVFTFEEITQAFTNFRGEEVGSFTKPHRNLEVNYRRLGGWPTIEGTRIPFDTIATIVDGRTITTEDVEYYYPGVTAAVAADAVAFQGRIEGVA